VRARPGPAWLVACTAAALLCGVRAQCAPVNVAATSCAVYENDILGAPEGPDRPDPIDTVMWLFGFSVAASGERMMYGDSLSPFGFAHDAECKAHPAEALLDALLAVKSSRTNPMDLTRLDCATFETRHTALRSSDPESANTLTMWLFGFAVARSGGHVLDASALGRFDTGLGDRCATHPTESLFDALGAHNPAVPAVKARKAPAPAHLP
jgi:hypothetical protein